MTVHQILLLGNPKLYEKSEDVKESELDTIRQTVQDLRETLLDFRARYGIGRAIAAPQIGIMKRVIYMNIKGVATVFLNPVFTNLSDKQFDLWDDCMSFPNLLVQLTRHKTCDVEFRDLDWNLRNEHFEDDLSELIQHEYDHLDGILAVDRAKDLRSFRYRILDENNNLL